MRSGSVWLLGLAGAALSNAVAVDKRDGPAVLTVPMVRENHTPRHLSKRSKTIAVNASLGSVNVGCQSIQSQNDRKANFSNLKTPTYLANMTFGTPPQDFRANLDLWEDQSWIKSVYGSSCATFYRHDPSDCDGYGGYNQSRSTTAKKNEKFSNDDGDLDLKGDYVTDAFSIGGVDVDEMKLGVITSSEIISSKFVSISTSRCRIWML